MQSIRSTPLVRTLTLTLLLSATAAAQEPVDTATQPPVGSEMAPPPPQTSGLPATTAPAEPTDTAWPQPTSIATSNDARVDVVERSWPNRPLLVTGLVVFGGTYGASAIVAAASDRPSDEKLFYPIVGPWMALKDRDCEVEANDCADGDTFNRFLIGSSGVLQGAGAVAMLLSLVIPESTTKPWYLIGDEELTVGPSFASNLTGVTAVGRF
jgi:hypothetical protein